MQHIEVLFLAHTWEHQEEHYQLTKPPDEQWPLAKVSNQEHVHFIWFEAGWESTLAEHNAKRNPYIISGLMGTDILQGQIVPIFFNHRKKREYQLILQTLCALEGHHIKLFPVVPDYPRKEPYQTRLEEIHLTSSMRINLVNVSYWGRDNEYIHKANCW